MKVLLVLVAFAAVANAGVGVVTPEIEAKAHMLWQRYCATQSEGGSDGGDGLAVYCKISGDKFEVSQQHAVEIAGGPAPAEQVVFVQPPSYHYKHDVVVTGGGASAPKTVIYVKPSKNTHEVNVQDNTSPGGAPQKPSLYFLKGSHGGEQQEEQDGQPVTPTGTYLPPASGGYN